MKTLATTSVNIFQAMVNEWREGDYSSLLNAICTTNGDPYLIEDEEMAEEAARFAMQDNVTYIIHTLADVYGREDLEEEYQNLCELLDLETAAAIVEVSEYNGLSMLICFAADQVVTDERPVYSVGCSTDEWDQTFADGMTYQKALDFFEELTNDPKGERYQDLANHCTGGCFWVADDSNENERVYVKEFRVEPLEN